MKQILRRRMPAARMSAISRIRGAGASSASVVCTGTLPSRCAHDDPGLASNAPSCVNLTVLESSVENSYLLCLVNWQEELPNIPVHNLVTELRLPNSPSLKSCQRVSTGQDMDFDFDQGVITLTLAQFETVEMIRIILK